MPPSDYPAIRMRLARQQLLYWVKERLFVDQMPPWQVHECLRGMAATTAAWCRLVNRDAIEAALTKEQADE